MLPDSMQVQAEPCPAPPRPAPVEAPAPASMVAELVTPEPAAVEPVAPPPRRPIFAPTVVEPELAEDPEPQQESVEPEPEVDPHVLDAQRLRDRMIESSRARRAEADGSEPVDPELPNWYDPAPMELSPKRKAGRSGR